MDYLQLVGVALLGTIVISVIVAVIGAVGLTIHDLIKQRNSKKDNQLVTKEEFKKSKNTLDNLKDLD